MDTLSAIYQQYSPALLLCVVITLREGFVISGPIFAQHIHFHLI